MPGLRKGPSWLLSVPVFVDRLPFRTILTLTSTASRLNKGCQQRNVK